MTKNQKIANKKNFSIKEALADAWRIFKANKGLLIGLTFATWLINIGLAIVDYQGAGALGFAVGLIISMGWVTINLKLADGKNATFDELFTTYRPFLNMLFATLIVVAAIMVVTLIAAIPVVGLVAIATKGHTMAAVAITLAVLASAIPMAYLAVIFSQFQYFVVEHGLTPINALSASVQATKGVRWKLVWFIIIVTIINILGLLFFLVGLLITGPITQLAAAIVYRKIASQTNLKQAKA